MQADGSLERGLRESEQRYRWLVQNTAEAVWRFELDDPVATGLPEDEQIDLFYKHAYLAECNESTARLYGFPASDAMVGMRLDRFMIRSDPCNEEYLRAFVRSRYYLTDAESVETGGDGTVMYLLNNLVGVVEGGRLIRAWGTSRDITARRRAEEELRRSNERYRLLSQTAEDILLTDEPADLVRRVYGRLAGQLDLDVFFHYQVDEAGTGLRLAACGGVDDGTAARLERPASDRSVCGLVFSEGRPAVLADVGGDTDLRTELIRSLGITAYACHPLSARGRLIGTLGFGSRRRPRFADDEVSLMRAVSDQVAIALERRRLLEQEKRSREAAEQANRAKDEFLAVLSHELRNPLNAMLGWTRLLRMGALGADEAGRAMAAVERAALTQTDMVKDLLDVSRIISGKMHLEVGPVNLVSVIGAALDGVRFAAESRRLRVETRLDPAAAETVGDPARLQQCVWNLLSNAVKFTSEGGLVEVVLERGPNTVCLSVRDTGIGIPADFLPHLFERFRQADASSARVHKGLGLGLAIVKHLVELHGGSVGADSAGPGCGATFRIELPVRQAPVRADGAPAKSGAESPRPPAPDARLRGVRVLVVDDEADARDLTRSMLSALGAEVAVAENAEDGIRRMRDFRPDVLLSDIGMSGQDGYDFIRRVRGLPASEGGAVPAAALTAYAAERDRQRAVAAGFQAHIPKPVDPGVLFDAVAALAGRAATTEKSP